MSSPPHSLFFSFTFYFKFKGKRSKTITDSKDPTGSTVQNSLKNSNKSNSVVNLKKDFYQFALVDENAFIMNFVFKTDSLFSICVI